MTPLRRTHRSRRGAVLVWFAILLVLLLGLVGLVVDGGMLMSSQRHAQNAADAAATAAAVDRMRGRTVLQATETANTFVKTHNNLPTATVTLNSPPASGPYAGNGSYCEAIVSVPVRTSFIQVLGVNPDRAVAARAVAGYEPHAAGEGVMVLNRAARPGLNVTGTASLSVDGRIVVNSDGGGLDENYAEVLGTQKAATTNGNIFATEIAVVGGVDNPAGFKPYVPGDPMPLKARSLPEPDPLLNLPTPTVAQGVDPTLRGSPSVTNQGANGLQSTLGNYSLGLNYRVPTSPPADYDFTIANGLHVTSPGEVVLFPGIYNSIDITGGKVFFTPGIYVLAPQGNTPQSLKITGGIVSARYVMFYNTSKSYSPSTGTPDINDAEDSTALPNQEYNGGFTINTGTILTPLNTVAMESYGGYGSLYPGAKTISSDYNGMLWYQRRRNQSSLDIQGGSADGVLRGTFYAKWSSLKVSGQGSYDAQFIVGDITVSGGGVVSILGAGTERGKANQVFLVE